MQTLLFSKNHIWIKKSEEQVVRIGISDYAQEKLGSIVFVNLPECGDAISMGDCIGDVESIKTVSDIISPVEGEVVQINDDVVDSPELINEDPYENWLIEIKLDEIPTDLMSETEYMNSLE